uniref:Helitron helicase-like domain-containing protein n=1 Tax=Anopheles arabiensis TaxID=7173 RepID=A0A182HLU7_ANOAR
MRPIAPISRLELEIVYEYVIEFQKRGLPHAHLLLILGDDDKPQTPDDYDKFVSAEISDPTNKQQSAISDGVCSKRYPKPFCDQTHASDNGFPEYRRRYVGRTVTKKGVQLDNRHVVPYNPWLSHKYDCHIDVEICTSITGVKYLAIN